MAHAHSPKNHPLLAAILVIGVAAFCVLVPCFWLGIPSGHDFEYHFNSWIEVLGQWRQGIIYPHWSALAHFGFGEARYIFYPPASWTLGAALGAVLPWTLVSHAYNWIALTLAGLSMFVAARRLLPYRDALFAAVFYAANPYHLVIVYWRSANAELLASAFLPLLLIYVLRLDEDGVRTIAPLSLLVAAGWLTNIPTAVMMMYSLGLLTLWLAWSRRSWKVVVFAGAAVVLGLAMAAIYLLPVWHQRSWVALSQVLTPGVRPLENFLFYVTHDEDHNRFNRIVSVVALWEIVILGCSLWVARRKSANGLWWPLTLWGAMCAILMIRWTLPLWNHVPELQYVQFPWRWLLCLNTVVAITLAFALQRWWLRVLVCAVAISSVPFVWYRIQPAWWDKAPDLQEMADNQHEGVGNDGTDEYVPVAADSYDVDQNAPQAAYEGSGNAKIRIENWQAERRTIVADASAPGSLTLRLFNYPLWKVDVNGRAVETQSTEHTGLMIVPIEAGENRVEIRFIEGWDRKVGALISALALFVVLVLWLRTRKGPMPARMLSADH
jgi:hypothetical protein